MKKFEFIIKIIEKKSIKHQIQNNNLYKQKVYKMQNKFDK